MRARLPGRTRKQAAVTDRPVVGDWVVLGTAAERARAIDAVLPRRTKLSRRAAHETSDDLAREQVVAANVDVVFITLSLADETDLRLLERYLTLAWDSGARPAILLTKSDLVQDPDARAAEISPIAGDVPVIAVSTRTGSGLDRVRSRPRAGDDRVADRSVGRRQVHHRQRARRRGAPGDRLGCE